MMTYFYTSDINLGIPKFSLKQNILLVNNNGKSSANISRKKHELVFNSPQPKTPIYYLF